MMSRAGDVVLVDSAVFLLNVYPYSPSRSTQRGSRPFGDATLLGAMPAELCEEGLRCWIGRQRTGFASTRVRVPLPLPSRVRRLRSLSCDALRGVRGARVFQESSRRRNAADAVYASGARRSTVHVPVRLTLCRQGPQSRPRWKWPGPDQRRWLPASCRADRITSAAPRTLGPLAHATRGTPISPGHSTRCGCRARLVAWCARRCDEAGSPSPAAR